MTKWFTHPTIEVLNKLETKQNCINEDSFKGFMPFIRVFTKICLVINDNDFYLSIVLVLIIRLFPKEF